MRWLCLLFISACGLEEPPTERKIDERLLPYIQEFKEDCSRFRADCERALDRVHSITIHKAFPVSQHLSEDTIGICQFSGSKNWIMIKEDALDLFYQQIRALMYHELAHCAYELPHVTQKDRLMSPELPKSSALIYNWKGLVEEMFKQVEERHGN